jgi:hypothetical protein
MSPRQLLRYAGQALAYAAFAGVIGYFSTSPAYVHFPADQALIRLSLRHAGQLKDKCRERSDAELAQLAPNMRTRLDCTRGRSPVVVRLVMDGKALYEETLQPSGLSHDGASTLYRRIPVATGRHELVATLNDNGGSGATYANKATLTLLPAQVLVIDFKAGADGFLFK